MDDERLAKIEQEKKNALNQSNGLYNSLIQDNQNLYNIQNDYANEYERTQNDILDKQLDYNQNIINQQKEVARQNKETESRKALNDYTAYVNPYGYNSEALAQNGLLNSGVSETSKLGAYNTYQNRLATANKVMQDAFTQYDNDINQARLTNDVQKAQNALSKLQMQIEFAQNYYNNKNNLSINQLNNNQNLDNNYYNRYQTEYNNIQSEKERAEKIRQWEAEMAENQRQYNENLAFKEKQAAQEQANWEKEYALAKKSSSSSKSASSGGVSGNNKSSETYLYNYANTVNPDVQYGSFDNGYQPNNINGTPLQFSGQTVSEFTGSTGSVNSGGKSIDNQKVWQIGDRYYAWDGYANVYKDITDYKNYGIARLGGGQGSFGSGGSMGGR